MNHGEHGAHSENQRKRLLALFLAVHAVFAVVKK